MEGEGVRGGVPLPHQGVFAYLGFKISDLVHHLSEFRRKHNFTACFILKWMHAGATSGEESGKSVEDEGEGVSSFHTREFLYF